MLNYYFIDAEELKKRITSRCEGCKDNGKNYCNYVCDVHEILDTIDDMIDEVNSEIENPKDNSDIKETKQ